MGEIAKQMRLLEHMSKNELLLWRDVLHQGMWHRQDDPKKVVEIAAAETRLHELAVEERRKAEEQLAMGDIKTQILWGRVLAIMGIVVLVAALCGAAAYLLQPPLVVTLFVGVILGSIAFNGAIVIVGEPWQFYW